MLLENLCDLQSMRRVVSCNGRQIDNFTPVVGRQLFERRSIVVGDLFLFAGHFELDAERSIEKVDDGSLKGKEESSKQFVARNLARPLGDTMVNKEIRERR
jgi:hypothetical protein